MLSALMIGGLNIPLARAESGPLTRSDYDSVAAGADEYSYWREQVKVPGRITYVNDPAGQRGIVQRVEVRPADNNVAVRNGNTGERAEVLKQGDLGSFADGQTIVMSWSTFIDSGFASPPGGWNCFVQIHVTGGKAQSPWQLSLVGDEAELKLRLFGGGEWSDSEQPAGSVEEWFSLGMLPKNQWNDFVMEVRFDCTGAGFARLWRNGKQLVDAQNRKIGYCGDPGLYWKQGFYRAAYDKTTELWFDDTFRWRSPIDAFGHYGWPTADCNYATGGTLCASGTVIDSPSSASGIPDYDPYPCSGSPTCDYYDIYDPGASADPPVAGIAGGG